MSHPEMSEKVKIRIGDLSRVEERSLLLKIAEYAEFEVRDIDEIFSTGKVMMHGHPYGLITDARIHLTANDDARSYAARRLRANNIVANAILTNSLGIALLANFYIRINRPEVPTKMFNSEAKALEWLHAVLKEEKV